MPYSAVYYPSLSIGDENLLKQALLFWDHVHVIDPFNWRVLPKDERLRDAAELITRSLTPTEEAMRVTHDDIIALLERDLPPSFFPSRDVSDREEIYDKKFLDGTWYELQKRGLTEKIDGAFPSFKTSRALGHLMMAILADNCAGFTQSTITDRQFTYGRIFRSLAVEINASGTAEPFAGQGGEHRVLTIVPVLTLMLDEIGIERLVRLRKLEEGSSGHHYTEMRHNFFEQMKSWSENLAQPHWTQSDREELMQDYTGKLNRDFGALREELFRAGRGFVLSKEMAGLTAAVGGALATGGWAAPALAIPSAVLLAKMRQDYYGARFKALDSHFSSFLYLARRGRIENDLI